MATNNNDKITMKIQTKVHRKLQIVKGMLGTKDFSDTIEQLINDHLEKVNNKGK